MKHYRSITLFLLIMVACKPPEARQPQSQKSGTFIKKSVIRNKKLLQNEQILINNYIKSNPENNYIASKNGFWYHYNTEVKTDSVYAKFGDVLNFNYEIKDFNGVTIYSATETQTQNYVMDQEELFTGLRQGLKLMKAGETLTFLFPSQTAFGYYGDEKKIGSNIPLICKVTVNSIIKR